MSPYPPTPAPGQIGGIYQRCTALRPQYDSILSSFTSVLIVLTQSSEQGAKKTFALRIHHDRSLRGSKRLPPYLLGFHYDQPYRISADPSKLETSSTSIIIDLRNGTKMNSVLPPIHPQLPVLFRAAYGGMEIARFDVWFAAVGNNVDPQRVSYRTLPHRINEVGTFKPRYNTTQQPLSFTRESGIYHAFLLAYPQGTRKEDYREAGWFMDDLALGHISSVTRFLLQDSAWCSTNQSDIHS